MEVFNTSYMGAIFKTARKRAGLTQEQVAEQVDITPRFLMGLEKGEKRPSLEVLLRLAHLLNIPGDALHGAPAVCLHGVDELVFGHPLLPARTPPAVHGANCQR